MLFLSQTAKTHSADDEIRPHIIVYVALHQAKRQRKMKGKLLEPYDSGIHE